MHEGAVIFERLWRPPEHFRADDEDKDDEDEDDNFYRQRCMEDDKDERDEMLRQRCMRHFLGNLDKKITRMVGWRLVGLFDVLTLTMHPPAHHRAAVITALSQEQKAFPVSLADLIVGYALTPLASAKDRAAVRFEKEVAVDLEEVDEG
jgi:hypothetical protein